MRSAIPLFFLIAAAAQAPAQVADPEFVVDRDYRFEQLHATRIVDDVDDKGPIRLVIHVWRPLKNDRQKVVLFSHGSTGGLVRSPKEPSEVLPVPLIRFFLSRGYTVVAPMRRGRGESTGKYVEECSVYAGKCTVADQVGITDRGLRNALADVNSVIDHLVLSRMIPGDGKLLLVGHSRGGFLSLIPAGARPAQFSGVVNFAGGWLGVNDRLSTSEYQERVDTQTIRLAQAAKRTRVPTIWVYAACDPFYNEAAPDHLVRAWRAAGGQAEYLFIKEHSLPRPHFALQNPSLWEREVDGFLRAIESPAR